MWRVRSNEYSKRFDRPVVYNWLLSVYAPLSSTGVHKVDFQSKRIIESDFTPQRYQRNAVKVKKNVIAVLRFSFGKQPVLAATGTHMPYGITQCYLPPGRGDIPALTHASEAGTRFSDPGGMQG